MSFPPEKNPCPRILTPEEFKNDLAPDYVVQAMIYRSSTHVLTGASKTGKSWLAFQLVLCICGDTPFLGLEVRRAKVLLVSLEMTAGMVWKRMQGICRDVGVPEPHVCELLFVIAPTQDYVPKLDLGSDPGREHLRTLIRESGAEVVILDTLYRFLPSVDPNSNAEMGPVFGALNELAQETGAALVMLDHVAKGEQLGPVSQSALGAQIKGGASRVIIGLKRTSKEDGWRWKLDVESHFGSWDEPIFYERPLRPDGERGEGCVPCDASRAFNISLEQVLDLFHRFGETDDLGRRFFRSKRALTAALITAQIASGNARSESVIDAIMRDFSQPEGGSEPASVRPIHISSGSRSAFVFTLSPQFQNAPEGS